MARRPVIGLTPSPSTLERSHGTFNIYGLANTYTTAVESAGGAPIIIPPQTDEPSQLLDRIDGLLLTGGGDIDPARYGDDTVHSTTYGIHPGRDDLELELARAATERNIPLLCICRGIQVLNVALGGTLYQDVADQYSSELQHQQQRDKIVKHDPSHTVDVVSDSLLAATYRMPTIHVNSFHHQAIKSLANGLRAVGHASDGLIEAIEMPDHRWLLGVQWHPEMMYRSHPEQLSPFTSLVDAAAAARAIVV